MGAEDEWARRWWEASRRGASSIEGEVTAVDFPTGVVTVNTAGVSRVLPWAGPAPFVGGRVRVVVAGQQSFCFMGAEGSTFGEVASVAADKLTVTGDDGVSYTYPFQFGASFSAGQRVALDHSRQLVLFRVSTDPGVVAPSGGSAPPVSGRVTKTFKPTTSGNWYSSAGRWDSQFVEISISRSGYYFYGTQIADTIPNTATIISGSIYLREVWDNVPGTPSQLGSHGYASRPSSGPLALSGAINVSGTGNVSLNSTILNALKTGADYGVGFAQNTGWRRFDTYARSGAITITYDV